MATATQNQRFRLFLCLSCSLFGVLTLIGCGKDAPKPIAPPGENAGITTAGKTTAGTAAVGDDDDDDDDDEQDAAPPPRGATAGDVLARLPRPAPRLYDGATTATAMPDTSCEELIPEKGFKLARKIDVVTVSTKKGEPDQTLELCMFNRWLQRTDPELALRTGRKHHYVAAFPGTEVASWTTHELGRKDLNLSDDPGAGLAAGWATLVATGVPKWPAVAVISGRFFGGKLGEEVHYLRRGRVLQQKAGRWVWEPLTERVFATLDTKWLTKSCEQQGEANSEACVDVAKRVTAALASAKKRELLRARRMAGKSDPANLTGDAKSRKKARKSAKSHANHGLGKDPAPYADDDDPHAAWLRDGRYALNANKPLLAIRHALRAIVACGELNKETADLLAKARAKADIAAVRIAPIHKQPSLCEPLPDKPPPSDR